MTWLRKPDDIQKLADNTIAIGNKAKMTVVPVGSALRRSPTSKCISLTKAVRLPQAPTSAAPFSMRLFSARAPSRLIISANAKSRSILKLPHS